jgi:dTDP-4-dehydrorhamnose reductase
LKILITGSNGQLGRSLKKQFYKNKDITLILTDICEMDITDVEDVQRVFFSFNPDVVINCAANTAVDMCEDDKEKAFAINVDGAKNIAIVSNEIDAKMVHISTDYVFDGEAKKPYIESDTPNPQSVYGMSKLEGEKAVLKNNPKSFILRTAWLYGEGKNFVKTMLNLSTKMDTLKVVNDQVGSPTSAKEVSKAIALLIETERYGIYHGTCENECSWYEFAKRIFELKNIDITLTPCTTSEFPMKAKRPKYSVLDNKNFREEFGYVFPTWQEAIEDFFSH